MLQLDAFLFAQLSATPMSSFENQQHFLVGALLKEATQAEKTALEQALRTEREMVAAEKRKMAEFSINMGLHGKLSGEHFTTRCGILWKFLARVDQHQFDRLRREHQVSKNRHVGYGVRYACTRNAKARDNCPYLMLCMPCANGTLKVYSRNGHNHPVKGIRPRDNANSHNPAALHF